MTQNNLKKLAKHLEWIKENKDKLDGALFALEVLGYKVEVDDNGKYIITER